KVYGLDRPNLLPAVRNQLTKRMDEERTRVKAENDRFNEQVINGMIKPFRAEWFKLDPSFLPMLPDSAVWANRMRMVYDDVQIRPCFSKMHVSNFFAGKDPNNSWAFRMDMRIDLDFYLSTGTAQNRSKEVLFARAQADKHIDMPGYEFLYYDRSAIS